MNVGLVVKAVDSLCALHPLGASAAALPEAGGDGQETSTAKTEAQLRAVTATMTARGILVLPNVRAKPTAEADAGWRRKDDTYFGLESPDGGRRSGSGG
jgi:hypothetical protein